MLGFDGMEIVIKGFNFTAGFTGILSGWVLQHPLISSVGMLFATAGELALLYFSFRPALFRVAGFLVVGLHLGFMLVMRLPFHEQLILVLIFSFGSPFAVRP